MTTAATPTLRRHPATAALSIDWEELPSLAHLVTQEASRQQPAPAWQDTMPAGLDMLEPARFLESLPGLQVQETSEPEIFRLFFDR